MPDYLQKYYELATVVRTDVVAEGRQFTMDAVADLTDWCGGQLETRDGNTVLVVPPGSVGPGGVAQLGDYVMHYGAEWWVEPAGGFTNRWHPGDQDVPASAPERMYAPFTVTYGESPWS